MDPATRLRALLVEPGLVVVTGHAGVGKSTVARAVLADARWVDAAGCTDAEAAVVELARGLRVPVLGSSGPELDVRVGVALGGGVVVLDGVDGFDWADLVPRVDRWRAEAPALRVAVTTRRSGTAPGARALELAPLGAAEGLALLQELVGPGADPARLGVVATWAEGLPAALVAAASAVRAVGLAEVASLLGTTGLPGLERLLASRITQLTEADRASLLALSPPGDALDAADAAALAGDDVLDVLGRLRAAGLMRAEGVAVLPAVRDHLRRTAPGAWADAAERFVAVAVERAVRAYERVEDSGDPAAWQALSAREASTRAALRLPVGPQDRLRLLLSLEPVVLRRGPYTPYVAELDAATRVAVADPTLEARAARVHAELLAYSGRVEDAWPAIERATDLARRSEVPAGVLARTLVGRAWIGLHERGIDGASTLAEAQELARGLPDPRERDHLLAHAALIEAAARAQAGATRRTADANHRAARLARAAGDRAIEALALRNLGDAWAEAGDTDRARAALGDALALTRVDGDTRSECRTLAALGVTTLDAGDAAAALPVLAEAKDLAVRLGDRRLEGIVLAYVGIARALVGDPAAARAALDRAVAIAIRVDNTVGHAWALALRACLLAAPEPARSVADAAAARELAERTGHQVLLATVAAAESAAAGLGARVDPLAAGSYDLRLATRVAALAPAAPSARGRPEREEPGLSAAADGAWFELGGVRVDLQARGPLRRILQSLCAAREADAVVELEGLFAAGWPGERATRTAARNRVYNALHGLRKLGLEGWVVRRDRGWCLDPTRPVHVA